jgi:hypothetical protein
MVSRLRHATDPYGVQIEFACDRFQKPEKPCSVRRAAISPPISTLGRHLLAVLRFNAGDVHCALVWVDLATCYNFLSLNFRADSVSHLLFFLPFPCLEEVPALSFFNTHRRPLYAARSSGRRRP